MKQKWSKKLPKKEGWYWFYGYRFANSAKKELCIVVVRKISNGFLYVCDGAFLNSTGNGKFIPAILPELETKNV